MCHSSQSLVPLSESTKVTFLHSKDTTICNKEEVIYNKRKVTQKSSVANIKTTIYPKFYIMEDTESCRGSSPDPFCISFCIQKVSGDLHYLLAKRLVNTFWLSSLMNVNLVSPEVFFLSSASP